MQNSLLRQSEGVFEKVRQFRRHLHRHPELSFQETGTQAFIASALDAEGIFYRPVGGTGILARIEGKGDLSEAVVLRADIDALPVTEQTGLEFSSAEAGIMHACGHDMHAAALFGALLILSANKADIHGTVFGLFQPGEERNPGGATLVLQEEPFRNYSIRAFAGQHIEPELPVGVFGFRPGKYMASSDELRFTVHGRGGHGAMREKIADPVATAAELITKLLSLPGENPDKNAPSVLSIGCVKAEGSTNVIPDTVYLEGTLRAFDESWREKIKGRIQSVSSLVGDKYGTTVEVDISKGFPSVINDSVITQKAITIATDLFGSNSVVQLDRRPTAEDFGFYTRLYPSVFYRLGVGAEAVEKKFSVSTSPGQLHTPTLCPNENALLYGAAFMAELAIKL